MKEKDHLTCISSIVGILALVALLDTEDQKPFKAHLLTLVKTLKAQEDA